MAGKRVSLASLAKETVESTPGASRPDLIHVHPDTVAPTPLNPRRNFDESELRELGEDMRTGQLQPCVAVSKAAYLKLYPEHAEQLPDACRYVMAAGERRWRAAAMVKLDTLDVMLRHDLTESRIRFLSAVLSENVQRANFNPIEEANGVQAMLDLHDGNQAAAARAIGKSKGWVNQRIGLLRLTDEMVQLVLDGKLTAFREMRRYAAMPPEEQYATWKLDQEQPRPSKPAAPPEALTVEAVKAPDAEAYTAVHTPAPSPKPTPAPSGDGAPGSFTAVKPRTPEPTLVRERAQTVPAEDRTEAVHPSGEDAAVATKPSPAPVPAQAPAPQLRPVPYDQPGALAMLLNAKVTDDELFFALCGFLGVRARERDPERAREVARAFLEAPIPQAD